VDGTGFSSCSVVELPGFTIKRVSWLVVWLVSCAVLLYFM
jgi:hypothetical protein